MTAVQSLLSRGLTPLERGLPHRFTAEGIDGEFDCLLNDTTYQVEPGVDGARSKRSALLSFRRSVPYNPVSGDVISVDGRPWRVQTAIPSDVKWDLNLIDVDE